MAAEDDYDTALQAVATALGTSSYDTARHQLRLARVHAARLADSIGADGLSVKQRALADLDSIEKSIDKEERRDNKFEVHSTWVPS